MKRRFFLLILLFAFLPLCAETAALSNALRRALVPELSKPLFSNVSVGIYFASVEGDAVYGTNATRAYIPASAMKALFSGFALSALDPSQRIATPIAATEQITDGTLRGDLYLIGKGDATLSVDDFERAARALYAKGLRAVEGNLCYDTSYFDEEKNRYAPNARHLYVPPSALTVNYGWIILTLHEGTKPALSMEPKTSYATLTHAITVNNSPNAGKAAMTYVEHPWGDAFSVKGTITAWDKRYAYLRLGVSRPALFAATLFKEALQKAGISVNGAITAKTAPNNAIPLYTIEGETIGATVSIMNKDSNNLIAEELNKYLAAVTMGAPGTRENAATAMETFFIEHAGFKEGTFSIDDASGLSTRNKICPEQFVSAFNYFYANHDRRKAFIAGLSRQGKDRYAMHPATPEHIEMYVKSGTLPTTGVNSVVGYVFLPETGEAYSFAILAQRTQGTTEAYSGTYTTSLLSATIRAFSRYLAR